MQPEQKSLYYITGGAESLLRTSPLLEIYKKKDIEVLILDDDIDEIVFSGIDKYGDIDLKAVNKASTSDDLKDDVRARRRPKRSSRCSTSSRPRSATASRTSAPPSASPTARPCIVSDEDEPSLADAADDARHGPERHSRRPSPRSRSTPITRSSRSCSPHQTTPVTEDAAWLLFDQALLMEGVPLNDPATFVQRLNRVLNLSI